jgi:plastocyanin
MAVGAVAVLALVASLQAQQSPPPATSIHPEAGRLQGIARISARLSTSRMRVRIYAEPGDLGASPTPPAGNPFANIVLYLENAASLEPSPNAASDGAAELPTMRQRDERFTPHVIAVTTGTTISFPNDDAIYHNVFSLSRARTFDLGRYPKGASKSLRFDRAGVVQVFCHIHADMSGYILVLPNRYFVTPDSSGRFAIEGIPPGEYRLVAWHERIKPIVTPVRVTSGHTTQLEVSIPLSESQKP